MTDRLVPEVVAEVGGQPTPGVSVVEQRAESISRAAFGALAVTAFAETLAEPAPPLHAAALLVEVLRRDTAAAAMVAEAMEAFGETPWPEAPRGVFAFRHDWAEPLIERLQWATGVVRLASGNEARQGQRRVPRRFLTYHVGHGRASDALVADWLADHLGRTAWWPLPQHAVRLGAAAEAGAFALDILAPVGHGFASASYRLEEGGLQREDAPLRAIVFTQTGWQVLTLTEVEPDRLWLAEPLARAVPAGATVLPLVEGVAVEPAEFAQWVPGVNAGRVTAQVAFEPLPDEWLLDDPWPDDPWLDDPWLDGLPVWPDGNWRDDPTHTAQGVLTRQDLSPADPWVRRDDPEQGTFELKLLRGDYLSDELVDDLPVLGPDEIVRVERFERAQWGELPNEITVVYTDWATGKEATVTVQNLAAIQLQGGVINQRRDYPGVNFGPLAARLALRDLRALGSPLARMTLTIAPGALERPPLPGDVFLLHWPRLGIERMVVRVTGIDTGTLGAAEWRIEAVEDVFGMGQTVLTPPPPRLEEPPLEPLPPALVLAVEVPYWELARRLSRADLAYLTDTDTYVGALACAGGTGQLNWQLATGPTSADLEAVAPEDYAPLLTLGQALPASEADALAVPVTALAQPERLAVGDYAYLVDALGAIREAVAILAFDAAAGTVDLARGVLDTTPQAHPAGTRLVGVGEWLAAETTERAPGESVFVAAIPRTTNAEGDAVLAANGAPIVLAGRQARPYPPGRVRLNGQREPAVVAGDLTLTWAHRDRTIQTAYLVRQDEGDIGPEPGTTYRVRVRDRNGALVRSETGLTGNTWTWDVASSATDAGVAGDRVTVEIEAERDGLTSWQPQVRRVERAGYGLRWGQYWGGV